MERGVQSNLRGERVGSSVAREAGVGIIELELRTTSPDKENKRPANSWFIC